MKEEKFRYGSAFVPSGEAKYSVIRWGWGGINRKDTIDSGQISDGDGIVIDPPYVIPSLKSKNILNYKEPIAIFGFDSSLLVIYRIGGKINVDYVTPTGIAHTGNIGLAKMNDDDFAKRSAVQFNVAKDVQNIVESTFDRKILIFPDKYSMDYSPTSDFTLSYLSDQYPDIIYSSVYSSRLFGVDENLVYASSYNDYADWDLDTANEYSPANAWVSMSQSNVEADGKFTAIATYDNHVVLFKKDFMQLVYNNKNPFRIVDIGRYGCDNQYAVAECEGVLYFVSDDSIYAFAGGTPKIISENLDIDNFRGACLGSFEDCLYLSLDNELYAYKKGVWSPLGVQESAIKQFATLDYGVAVLRENGDIDIIDWSVSGAEEETQKPGEWEPEYDNQKEWWFETDFMALRKLDVRRVKKVSVLCDMKEGAELSVYLIPDGEVFDPVRSIKVGSISGAGTKILRILTRQTSGYMHRLRFVGKGYARIYSAELKISWGGDVYVEG